MALGRDAVIARQSLMFPPASPPFTVVVAPDGSGDVRTFMEAWNLLPPEGGTIRLKSGTYTIPSTIQLVRDKRVRIIGDTAGNINIPRSRIMVSSGLVFDLLLGSLLEVLDVVFQNTPGQNNAILFGSTNATPWPNTPAGTIYLQNVTAYINAGLGGGARITKLNEELRVIDCELVISGGADGALSEDTTRIKALRLNASGISDIIVNVSSAPTLDLVDSYVLAARNDALAGIRIGGSSKIVNCNLSLNFGTIVVDSGCFIANTRFYGPGAGRVVLTINGSQNIIHGCAINWQASVVGTYNIFSNCNFEGLFGATTAQIVESGGADYNTYLGLQSKGSSSTPVILTLIGAHSFLNGHNVQTVNTTPVTLDRTYETVLVDASGGARVVNLPSAASSRFQRFTVKKIDATANPVNVTPAGADLIDGVNAINAIAQQYLSKSYVSDGVSWWIV